MPLTPSHSLACGLVVMLIAANPSCVQADERLPPLRINGVAMEVTRLSGDTVPSAIAGIEAGWRRQPGAVLPWRDAGEWRVLARREGRWSEVLQVRGGTAPSEAYLSRLDVQRLPAPVPLLPLPPSCRVRSTVESGVDQERVVQVTGRCAQGLRNAAPRWCGDMRAEGWVGGGESARTWRFRRRDEELLLILVGPSSPDREGNGGFTALLRHVRGAAP